MNGDPELLVATLVSMGFDQAVVTRLVARGGFVTLEEAVQRLLVDPQQQAGREDPAQETRMVIVVRKDLGMRTGKIASQVAHAAVALAFRMQAHYPRELQAWEANNTPKVCALVLHCAVLTATVQICLAVESLEALEALERKAGDAGLPVQSIRDAGRTQVESGSKTCMAVVATKATLDGLTGSLNLL